MSFISGGSTCSRGVLARTAPRTNLGVGALGSNVRCSAHWFLPSCGSSNILVGYQERRRNRRNNGQNICSTVQGSVNIRLFSSATAAASSRDPATPSPETAATQDAAAPATAGKNEVNMDVSKIRNVAIIAHVDHGKTTLVDEILAQSGMAGKWKRGARHLDSNDLEKERGITILSKVTRIQAPRRKDFIFNIVDTPGHADFGGEVERVLSMVDGVVLLVDAAEGPKTQTRFVLQKALQIPGIRPLVVINKIDKPARRAAGEVENEIFDLFASLDATEEQLDYPTLYASGMHGWCCSNYDEAVTKPPDNLDALFEAIEAHVLPPKSVPGEFSMLVSQMDVIPQLGPTVTGKVKTGVLRRGDKVHAKSLDNVKLHSGKVKELTVVRGMKREKVDYAVSGDLVSVSVSGFLPRWTQTLCSNPVKVDAIPCLQIDPTVICVKVTVNDSPLAGKSKYISLFDIHERLKRETVVNVAISVTESEDKSSLVLSGRGELQMGILIEEMRREGYEMTLSPPRVVTTTDPEDPTVELEPWESVEIDVPTDLSAQIIERLSSRGGELKDINSDSKQRSQMRFEIPSRCFFGMRAWVGDITGGQAALTCEMIPPRAVDKNLTPNADRGGVFIAASAGIVYLGDHRKASMRGRLFVNAGDHLYGGQIIGEIKDSKEDSEINICHKHDGYASTHGATGIGLKMSLEESLVYLREDECLEVTPDRITMRKVLLDPTARKLEIKKQNKAKRAA
ncbi:unnamed protein product [Amoebophrya sp. A25]|nr:unnamed protein product [Amoebophrya sp. A25]|eukprot:GSA25T00016450001.1